MRLSLLGPVYPYRGGIAHFTTLLAKKLIEAGHEVQMISFKKQYPAWLYPGASDKDHSPGRAQVDAEYLLTPLNPFSWRKTVTAIVRFQPQQVILPWWVTFWGPAFRFIITRLKRRGIPVTVLIHNTMPHEARALDRFLARRTLQPADRYIVMTEKEKGRLLALLPEAVKIDMAPLPIYHAFKPTPFSREALRQQMNLPGDQPVILYFGIVRPYKGLGVLIDALKVIAQQGIDAHLLIVGEFWEDQAPYRDQIMKLGLSDQVHLYARYIPDDEVAGFFEAADLFVAPYIDGTQSAALKTALGFGLPVVVTDVITDAMIEDLPERCRVVRSGDSEGLAEGMVEQMKVERQSAAQIEEMVARSWVPMLRVIEGDEFISQS
jgi:glycosyltransferase involved in cell wall biosynthesis